MTGKQEVIPGSKSGWNFHLAVLSPTHRLRSRPLGIGSREQRAFPVNLTRNSPTSGLPVTREETLASVKGTGDLYCL